MMSDVDLAAYEGLVRATAARYAPLFDDDFEDVAQTLRLKVWQALKAYDPRRSAQSEKDFVFSCVRNRVKDMFKQQDRLNSRRGGAQLHIADFSDTGSSDTSRVEYAQSRFEARYLSIEQEAAYFAAEDEDVPLPSTLNELERTVVRLLVLDFNQTEIATALGVTRARVRSAYVSVQEKMADWRPTADDSPAVPEQSLQAA